jgi:peptide-methionine (S)-S-oxide reductase
VVRTRVGYAGGTTPEPTYRRIGDHSETIEVDYDPRVLSYRDLLRVFFSSHSPSRPAISTQYRSAIFYRDEDEREAAEEAVEAARSASGPVFTAVERFSTFHLAEDYHQKYGLRRYADLAGEFSRLVPGARAFVDSTAVARVNGWLSGCGGATQIERELPLIGLSAKAQAALRDRVLPGAGAKIVCG